MKKKRPKHQTSDDRARDPENLEPEPEHGCQIFRKKLLCGKPTFVIVNRVSICVECWERMMNIAADSHVDQLELRRRYEPGPTTVGRGTAAPSEGAGSEDRTPPLRHRTARARKPETILLERTA